MIKIQSRKTGLKLGTKKLNFYLNGKYAKYYFHFALHSVRKYMNYEAIEMSQKYRILNPVSGVI